MDVIRAVLPENWFVVAFLVASGVVSFAIFVGLRRLGSRRTVLYVYGLASAVAVVLAFRIGGRISTTDVWKSLLLVVYVQGFLFGGLIWKWQGDVSGGPELREEAGLPQYEGRDRAYWTARLTFSPLPSCGTSVT